MMKLFSVEIRGLKIGLSNQTLILLFVLLPQLIFPQIPFKGFCKLNSFNAEPGYDHLISINFDNDEYSDLLIFNPLLKTAKLYSGKNGINFSFTKDIDFPFEISDLEPIANQNKMIESYAFTSRRNRSFGTLKFSTDGQVTISNQIQFDYYPGNISVSLNINNSEHEFIVSGNSFNGISIIAVKENNLFEKKITDKTVFKDADFIDLNSDGNEDLVAINSIENKIHFFFRNSKNDFEDLRQINFKNDITSLQVFDINYDGFKDIIAGTQNSIIIYFGDATASYNKSINVKTFYQPDKFVYGDYNRDGFFDFTYLNKQTGIVSTIFAKDFNTFSPDLIHLKESGLEDIIPFYSKFVYGSAYLNINGKINILSKINSLSKDQKIVLAIKPDLLVPFDYLNNGIKDFAFTDLENNTLNVILRDAAGLLENLYSIELFEKHNNLKVCSNSEYEKCFYFFSPDKRSVESLEIDFKKFTFNRKFYYSEGLIQDVLISRDYKNDPDIFILYEKNKKLGLQVQTKIDENNFTTLHQNLEKNWGDAVILSERTRTVGYLQRNDKNLILKTVNADDKNYKIKLNINAKSKNFYLTAGINSYSDGELKNYFGLIQESNKTYLFVNEKLFYQSNNNEKLGFRITNKNQLFFGKNNTIFISDKYDKSLYEVKLNLKTNNFKVNKMFSDVDITNFLVEKLEPRNNNLIFTNSIYGTIEIRQLPK